MAGPWRYDVAGKRYLDRDGGVVARSTTNDWVDGFLDGQSRTAGDLARMLDGGQLTLPQWEREMRALVKRTHVASYVVGRGGKAQMTQRDYGSTGWHIRQQYGHLRDMARQVQEGDVSAAQLAARSEQYAQSARAGFFRGYGRRWVIELPYHPADGGTPCHGNCRCAWDITEDEAEVRAYWRLGGSARGPCAGCQSRASESAPLVFPRPAA